MMNAAGCQEAEKKPEKKSVRHLLGILGPGLVTGASDDDPSGIATYTQAGAAFGLSTLWMTIATLPLMTAIQEMCARIGMVTRQGLTAIIRKNYPAPVLWIIIILSFPAIILNIGANLAAMGAVASMLVPGIDATIFSICFGVLIAWLNIILPYRKIASILQWLCLSLGCYLLVPFVSDTDWESLVKTISMASFTWDYAYISMIVAILGTTISPYLFFWQTSMEVEEVASKGQAVDQQSITDMNIDIRVGMFISNLVSFFIILAAAVVLFPHGVHEVETVGEAAAALKPLAGRYAYLLFAAGILGTGLLSIPVLAGSLSYMVSEAFGWTEGLDKKFGEAKGFYMVMIVSIISALSISWMGISPMRALILTAIIYGIISPVLIGIILHICNNRIVMGDRVNSRSSNIMGLICMGVMASAACLLLSLQLWG